MDNEILISTKIDVDYAAAEKELAAIQRRLDKLKEQQEIRIRLVDENLSGRRDQAAAALEQEKAKLGDMKLWRDGQEAIDAQKDRVRELQKEFTRLDNAVTRYNEQIVKGNMEMQQLDAKAKTMASTLADRKPAEAQEQSAKAIQKTSRSAGEASNNIKHASTHTNSFLHRLKMLAKRALIFSVFTMALRSVRSWLGNVISASEETATAWANLKGSFMTLVQTIMNAVLPVLQSLFAILTKIVSFVATVFSAVFGSTLAKNAADAQSLANGLGDANGEAKELKRTLAGFDEINILEDPNKESGGGGASASSMSFDFADIDFSSILDESEMQALKEVGEAIGSLLHDTIGGSLKEIGGLILDTFKDIDFTTLLQSIKGLIESISRVLKPLFNIIKTVWEKSIAPMLKKTVENWLPRVIDVVSEIFDALGKVFDALEPIISAIMQIAQPITEIAHEIGTIIFEMVGSGISTVLEIIAQVLEQIAPVLQWIADLLTPIFELLAPIIGLILELASALNDSLLFILKLIIDLITGDMDAAREDFNGYIGDMSEHLTKFKELFEKIGEAFGKVWEAIKNAGIAAWNGIKSAWEAVSGFFSGVWWAIKSGVVGAMNAVIGAIESAINWIIDLINGIIGGINDVIYVVGRLFGGNWTGLGYVNHVYIGRVPLLAQGAVVPPNNPFLATLGDNKTETEIVSPLSTMKEAFLEALRESNLNGNVNVYLDGKQISDSVTKYQMRANRALGV